MIDEAASSGFFTTEHFGKFPRIQILTIEQLLDGRTIQMPQTLGRTLKQAEKMPAATTVSKVFSNIGDPTLLTVDVRSTPNYWIIVGGASTK